MTCYLIKTAKYAVRGENKYIALPFEEIKYELVKQANKTVIGYPLDWEYELDIFVNVTHGQIMIVRWLIKRFEVTSERK